MTTDIFSSMAPNLLGAYEKRNPFASTGANQAVRPNQNAQMPSLAAGLGPNILGNRMPGSLNEVS